MASRATQKMHAALSGHSGDTQDENAAARFVHLHVHSAFSLLESALPLKKVMDLAIADNQPALAITDRNNMFGALEFSEKASKDGLQPIMGCKLAISFQDGNDHVPRSGHVEFPYLVFLAMNEEGFANLKKLVSSAHIGCDDGDLPNVSIDAIENLNCWIDMPDSLFRRSDK